MSRWFYIGQSDKGDIVLLNSVLQAAIHRTPERIETIDK